MLKRAPVIRFNPIKRPFPTLTEWVCLYDHYRLQRHTGRA